MKTETTETTNEPEGISSVRIRRRWIFLGLLLITFAAGSWLTIFIGSFVDNLKRQELLQLVKLGSAGINEQRIKSLTGTPSDHNNPDWMAIRNRFLAMLKTDSSLRWIYLVSRKDSAVFFFMDTPEPGNAVPGEIYDDAPPELYLVFEDQTARTAGPYTDRWGTFISAFHPVIDPETRKTIAVLGFDIQASDWNRMILNQQFAPVLITLLVLLLETLFFVYLRRRQQHEKKLQAAYSQLDETVRERTAELTQANLELAKEVRERLSVEESLRLKSEELDRFFNVNLDLLCIADTHGNFRRMNKEWENTLGYPLEEMIGKRFLDFVHPDDFSGTTEALKELQGQKAVTGFVNRYRCKNGSYRWIEWRSFPQENLIYTAARDITERIDQENRIIEREKKLRSIFRASPVAIGVVTDRVFAEVNQRMCEMTGYSKEELIGKSARILYPDQETYDWVGQEKYRQIRESGIGTVETRWKHKSGQIIDIILSSTAMDPLNDSTGIVFTAFDITEQKKTVEALMHSENKFRNLAEETGDWIWEMDSRGRFTYCNPKASEITGYSIEELIGHTPFEWMEPEDSVRFRELFQKSLRPGHFIHRVETRMKTRSGRFIHLEISNHPVFDEMGQMTGIRGITRDVTDRKIAEYELLETKNRLEYILGVTKTGIDVIDRDFNLRYVDPEWQKKYGVYHGKKCFAYFRDRRDPCPECGIPVAFETKQITVTEEILPHENNRIIEVHTIPFQNPAGEWLVAEFNIDITDHKRIEQALKDSETRYRAVMEQATEGILLFDVQSMKIVETNRTYQTMLGYTADELLQLTVYEVIDHDPQSVDEYIELIKDQHRLFIGNRRHRHKQGHPVDVEVSTYLIEIHSQQTICVVVRNITERLRSEKTMRELLQRQALILQSLPVVFYTASPEGDLPTLWISDQVETISGYPPSSFTGDPFFWTKHLHEDDLPVMVKKYKSVLEIKELTLEYRWLCADGTYHWFQDQLMLINDAFGKPSEIIGFWMDITGRKSDEEEKHNLEAQLQHSQKLESLGVLAGGIAHDFNNLLTSVLGYADLSVKKSPPDSPVRDYLMEIEQAALRASDLCRQMLAYSGKGKFVIQPTDIASVIREMTSILKVSLSKKIVLQYQFEPDTPMIDADQAQIRQIILNLVINASEAVGDKDGVISIKTGSRYCTKEFFDTTWLHDPLPEGQYVFMEVSDSGCGMNPETLAKIFDPFFTTKFSGRGLGLAATLGIVRGHKGALSVMSEPGKGTSFTIFFPAGIQTVIQPEKPQNPALALYGQGVVMLVDDEEPIRKLGKEILEMNGFEAETASDGFEAVSLFKLNPEKYDCLILDLTMPKMDGKQTLQELIKIRKDVKVVISSGYSEHEIAKKFTGESIAGFAQKPYDIDSLCGLLKTVISRKAT